MKTRAGSLVQRMSPAFRVGHVAGDVAHDLNNHLQVILGNAELLEATADLPEPARLRLARIVDAGRRATAGNDVLLALVHDVAADERAAAADRGDATLGDLVRSHRPALARLVGTGATLDLAIETSVDALPANAVAGHDALPHLAACLVLHARPALPPDTGGTLHVRSADDTSLHLYVDSGKGPEDGSPPGACVGVDEGGPDDTVPTLVTDILTSLAENVGGRVVLDGTAPLRLGPLVVLPLERKPANP